MIRPANTFRFTASTVGLAAALGSLVLAGCNPPGAAGNQSADNTTAPAALPLTTAPEPTSATAPPPTALPSAPPVRVVHVADPSQGYAYADRAYRYASVLADAPPDYTYDYGGVRPYVWVSNGSYQFAEPTPDGLRYYYYDPGSDYPYLIRDSDYSYGYDNGQLVVIYDRNGRIMDPGFIDQHADLAGRYLARARALRAAAFDSRHQAVAVASWIQRRAQIDADRERWEQQQQQYPDWRAYDQARADQEEGYWAGVQQRRAAESRAYDQALGSAYGEGRADQRGQDRTGLEIAGGVAALAAAAAIYNAGHHDHGGPPPAAAPAPEPGQGQRFAGGQPRPLAPAVAPAPQQGDRPGPGGERRLAAGAPAPTPGAAEPQLHAETAHAQGMTGQTTQAAVAEQDHRAQAAGQAQAEAQRAVQLHGRQQAAAAQAERQAAARQAGQTQARVRAEPPQSTGASAQQRQAQPGAPAKAAQAHAAQQQHAAEATAAKHAAPHPAGAHPPEPPPAERDKRPAGE